MNSLEKMIACAAVAAAAAALSATVPVEGGGKAGEGETMKLKPLSDSVIVSNALNFASGPFGTCINGQTFQQEAMVSFKGWQYATFFAEGGVLCAARRRLPDGAWQTIRFTEKSGWADWKVAWSAETLSVGEPLLDADRWRRDHVISIYTQMRPAAPGAPSPLRVMDLGIK